MALAFVVAAVLWMVSRWKPDSPDLAILPLSSITNSVGAKLVLIPAGVFRMGSPTNEWGRDSDEHEHTVLLTKPYYLGTTLVTEHQFRALFPAINGKPVSDSQYPVRGISWDQAGAFCGKLSAIEHRKYRLPTEAEWEYACRAGSSARIDAERNLNFCAWWSGNSGGVVHPVAMKKANVWGLYDMIGDVHEWCLDTYAQYLIAQRRDPVQTDPGFEHVTRGGSFRSPESECRAARRGSATVDAGADDVGFRLVLESDPASTPLP